MLGPQARTATELSQEVRVHQATLSRWLRQASTLRTMERDKPPASPASAKVCTAEEKLRIVVAAASCTPDEVGALVRREGLHEADLAAWREAMTGALAEGKPEPGAGKGAVQSKRIRHLEWELHRKDNALAEAAALLVLQKNVRAFHHLLGETDATFFAAPTLVRTLRRGFPRSLDEAPMLLPGGRAALRGSLEPWFDAKGLRPRVVGEFEDSARLKAFGQAGHGAFAGPTLIAAEIERQYRVAEGGPEGTGPRRSRARRSCALRLSGARRRRWRGR